MDLGSYQKILQHSEAESNHVAVGVVDGHVVYQTFMYEGLHPISIQL